MPTAREAETWSPTGRVRLRETISPAPGRRPRRRSAARRSATTVVISSAPDQSGFAAAVDEFEADDRAEFGSVSEGAERGSGGVPISDAAELDACSERPPVAGRFGASVGERVAGGDDLCSPSSRRREAARVRRIRVHVGRGWDVATKRQAAAMGNSTNSASMSAVRISLRDGRTVARSARARQPADADPAARDVGGKSGRPFAGSASGNRRRGLFPILCSRCLFGGALWVSV